MSAGLGPSAMHFLGKGCVNLLTLSLIGCAAAFDHELQRAKTSREPVFVGSLGAGDPDERGMIDVHVQMFNTSEKAYKYVDFSLMAYNRVGDAIRRSGDASPIVKLRFTGPLGPRRTPGTSSWPGVWYVQKVGCIEVSRIDITHMDGQVVAIEGPMLRRVLASEIAKGCVHG